MIKTMKDIKLIIKTSQEKVHIEIWSVVTII